jgi:hypothetical protein
MSEDLASAGLWTSFVNTLSPLRPEFQVYVDAGYTPAYFQSAFILTKLYKIIILPLVLYGCGTSSLTLRKERGLRVFENRVLRRIFGPNGMKC